MSTRAEKGKHMPEEAGSGDVGVKKAPTGELHGEGSPVFKDAVEKDAYFVRLGQEPSHDRDVASYLDSENKVRERFLGDAVAQEDRGRRGVISALKKPLENVKVEDLIRAQGSKGGKYNRELTPSEYQSELEDLAARYPASEKPDFSKAETVPSPTETVDPKTEPFKAETSGEPAKKEGKLGGWESKPKPWPWQEKAKQDGQASSTATKDVVGAKPQRERFRVSFDYETPEGQAKIAEAKARQQQELSSGSSSGSSQSSTAEQIAKSKEFLRGSFDRENLPLAERKKVFAEMNDNLENQRLTPEQRKEKAYEEEKARARALKKKSEEFLKGEFTRKAPDIDRKAAAAETTARLYPKTPEQLRDEAADEARAEKAKTAPKAAEASTPTEDDEAKKKAKEAKATAPAPKTIVPTQKQPSPTGEGKKPVEASTSKQPTATPESGTPAGKTPEEVKLQQLNEKVQGIYKTLPKIAQVRMASEVGRTTQEQISKLPKEEQAKFSDKKSAEYIQLYVENLQKASDKYNRAGKEKKSPFKKVGEFLKRKPKEEPKAEPNAPAKPVTAPRPAPTVVVAPEVKKVEQVPPPAPKPFTEKDEKAGRWANMADAVRVLGDKEADDAVEMYRRMKGLVPGAIPAAEDSRPTGGLTQEAIDVLRVVANGGIPTSVTPNLERILKENGISQADINSKRPEELMAQLKAKEAKATAPAPKTIVPAVEQTAATEAGERADEAQRKIAKILAKDPNAPVVEQSTPAPTVAPAEAAPISAPIPAVSLEPSILNAEVTSVNPAATEASTPASPVTPEDAAARLEQIVNKGKEEPKDGSPAAKVTGLVDVHNQPLSSERLNTAAAIPAPEQPAAAEVGVPQNETLETAAPVEQAVAPVIPVEQPVVPTPEKKASWLKRTMGRFGFGKDKKQPPSTLTPVSAQTPGQAAPGSEQPVVVEVPVPQVAPVVEAQIPVVVAGLVTGPAEQSATTEKIPPAETVRPFADRAKEILENPVVGKEAEDARKQTLQDLDNELQRIKQEQSGTLTGDQQGLQKRIIDARWGIKRPSGTGSEQPVAVAEPATPADTEQPVVPVEPAVVPAGSTVTPVVMEQTVDGGQTVATEAGTQASAEVDLATATPEQLDAMINALAPEKKQEYDQKAGDRLTQAAADGKTDEEQAAILVEHQREVLTQERDAAKK